MKTSNALGLAALLCAVGATAMAQTTATNSVAIHGIGSQVSTLAKDQRNQETKGLGSVVRGLAHALHLDGGSDADADADDDAGDDEAATASAETDEAVEAASGKGLGSNVSTLAKGQKDAADRTAFGPTVSALAREQGAAARQNASAARAEAAASRSQAASARAQAQTVRDVVGAAHGRGH
jgi:hypothetical protein